MGVPTLLLVREAHPTDAASIGEVHAEAWRVAYRDLFESDFLAGQVATRRSMWPAVMAESSFADSTLLVAERGDRVAAFAHFGRAKDGARVGEIYECYAHPSVWGAGVAKILFADVLDALADLGCRDVRLWTLAGANRARRFYVKSGFRQSGARREVDFGDGRPVLELEYVRSIRHLLYRSA
jgi:RimJ/RimL family protein N-acetyltransferase